MQVLQQEQWLGKDFIQIVIYMHQKESYYYRNFYNINSFIITLIKLTSVSRTYIKDLFLCPSTLVRYRMWMMRICAKAGA